MVLYLLQAVSGRAGPPPGALVYELSSRAGEDDTSAAARQVRVLARVSPQPAVVNLENVTVQRRCQQTTVNSQQNRSNRTMLATLYTEN